jgi:hypothetical protein
MNVIKTQSHFATFVELSNATKTNFSKKKKSAEAE